MNPTLKKWLPFIIIVIGFAMLVGMANLRPEPKKVEKKPNIPIVETLAVEPETVQLVVSSTGIVRSESEINLVPEVAGKIIYKSPKMINGGFFKKGELLYRIDPSDYQLQVNATEAEVAIQQVNFDREKQEQQIAEEEWNIYSAANPNEVATDLTLRKPQLAMAKANLDAANARLAISKKNLQRTSIYAPYNGSVKMKMMDVGQYVAPGATLAQIFSTVQSEIVISLDPSKASFVKINDKVTLSSIQMLTEHKWEGNVISVGGSLDAQSRLVNVSIAVKQPYEQRQPLLNGMFVDVMIHGESRENVFDIPLFALRDKNIVWTVSDQNELIMQNIELIHIQKNRAIIKGDFSVSNKLISSMLSYPTAGMKVRTQQ